MEMAQLKPTYRFGAPDVTAHQRKSTSFNRPASVVGAQQAVDFYG